MSSVLVVWLLNSRVHLTPGVYGCEDKRGLWLAERLTLNFHRMVRATSSPFLCFDGQQQQEQQPCKEYPANLTYNGFERSCTSHRCKSIHRNRYRLHQIHHFNG